MANSFELITKYISNAIDTVFATESKSAIFEKGEKFMDLNFKEAGYVKIANILLDGLSNYYRAGHNEADGGYSNYNGVGHNDGYKVGSASITWEIKRLRYLRGRQFQIDDTDNEETAGLLIANILREFLRTKVVPEVDAVRFSTIASSANAFLGNLVTETPVSTKGDANEIIHLFNKGFEWLIEHEVPEDEQVILVSPSTWTAIQNSEEITKFITQEDLRSDRGVTFRVPAYNGRPIIVVPSDRFYSSIVVDESGYRPASGAKIINYMIVSKKAIVPVVKVEKSNIFGPGVVQDFDGYKVNFKLYHDALIPANKLVGCYVSVGNVNASEKSNLVNVALTKTAAAGTYALDGFYTTPAGLRGTLIHKSTAFVLGATDNSAESLAVGATFKATAATEYFAVKDDSNKVIATGKATGLTPNA